LVWCSKPLRGGEKINEPTQTEYRRFKLIDKSKEKALTLLVKQKGLSKDDLVPILKTLEIRADYKYD